MSTINGSTATLPPLTLPAASSNAVPVSAAVEPSAANSVAKSAAPTLNNSVTSTPVADNQANAGTNQAHSGVETAREITRTGGAQDDLSRGNLARDAYVDKLNTKHISQQQADTTFQQINPNQKEALLTRSIERLTTEINKNQKQISNTVNAYSMIQVANDSLSEIQGGLKELSSLAQAATGERKEGQSEEDFLAQTEETQAQALDIVAGIQDLFESTKYGGDPLLTQNTHQTFASHNETEYGVTVSTHNVDRKFEQQGLYEIDLNSPGSIQESMTAIKGSMDVVRDIQSQYRAQETDFNTKMKKLFNTQEQLDSMHDRITSTDFAIQVAEKAQQEMVNNARGSVLAQANADSNRALNLLTN